VDKKNVTCFATFIRNFTTEMK